MLDTFFMASHGQLIYRTLYLTEQLFTQRERDIYTNHGCAYSIQHKQDAIFNIPVQRKNKIWKCS